LMCMIPIKMPDDSFRFNEPHLGLICVRTVNDLSILLYWTRLTVALFFIGRILETGY